MISTWLRRANGSRASCILWQVVPSTGTCKSINLDLARAAPYRYFTQYGPAHADQNLFHKASFIASFLFVSLVVLLHGVGRPGWARWCWAGLLTSPTRTHRHVHTLTHTHPYHTNSSRFLFILIHRSNPRTRYYWKRLGSKTDCGPRTSAATDIAELYFNLVHA